MKKKFRLKTQKEISNVFLNKRRYSNKYFSLYYKDNDLNYLRFAISIGKKFGNAVKRNECKRRIRHIIRDLSKTIGNYDFVIVVRKEANELNFQQIKELITKLIQKSKIIETED